VGANVPIGKGSMGACTQRKNCQKHNYKKCIHCGQLILRKISKIGATRCQILRLKCTKFDFRCLRPRPRWGSLQRSPDLIAVFKGPTSKGGDRERGEEGKGRGKGRGG